MKKVINITLGGTVFAIEEDAYTALSHYLDAVKKHLSNTDDYTEIANDIEGAIAEKFSARKRNEKKAVTSADVREVTAEMGDPSEFNEAEAEAGKMEKENETDADAHHVKKRFYRDTEDAVFAGVASGIAKYFDIDPVIVRLVFVLAVFFNGFGILAYIILWLVVPPAETTAQKYAMRGEKVTLKEIKEQVKKNFQSIEEVDYTRAKGVWLSMRTTLVKVFNVLGAFVRSLGTIIRFALALIFIIVGALGIAGLVSLFSILLFSSNTFFPQELHVALEILSSNALGIIALVSTFVAVFVPVLFCILVGASLLERRNAFTVKKTIILVTLWIVAITLAVTTSFFQAEFVITKLEAQGFTHGGHTVQINSDPFSIRIMQREDEPWGAFQGEYESGFSNEMMAEAISEFLLSQDVFSQVTGTNTYRSCTIKNLGEEDTLFPVYVWVYCAEYSQVDGVTETVSGVSGPVKISYPNELSYFDISQFSYEAPRDGALYSEDIKEIFPEVIKQAITTLDTETIVNAGDAYALENIATWKEIKDAIQTCDATSVSQTHSRRVTLERKGGEMLYAVEPNIDAILDVAIEAEEKCGSILMATE